MSKSVGQIVGTVVGGAVGLAFPEVGFSIGATVGGIAGGLIDPPKGPHTVGPRLDDLSFQSNTYGASFPRLRGTVPVVGNVFWLEGDKYREVPHTTKSGGKGGSKATAEAFKYYATFAVGFCVVLEAGQTATLRRMWIGSNLVYDASGATVSSTLASNIGAVNFTWYDGSDPQSPNPRMQADKGASNVSGYPGICYAVIEDLDLAPYSNTLTMAQVKVEVVIGGTGTPSLDVVDTLSGQFGPGRLLSGAQLSQAGVRYDVTTYDAYSQYPATGQFYQAEFMAGETNSISTEISTAGYLSAPTKLVCVQTDKPVVVTQEGFGIPATSTIVRWDAGGVLIESDQNATSILPHRPWSLAIDGDDTFFGYAAGATKIYRFSGAYPGAVSAAVHDVMFMGASESFLFTVDYHVTAGASAIRKFDRQTLTLLDTYTDSADRREAMIYVVSDTVFYTLSMNGTVYKWVNGVVVQNFGTLFPARSRSGNQCWFYVGNDDPLYMLAIYGPQGTGLESVNVMLAHVAITATSAKLRDIVTAECSLAGIDSSDLDLTTLTNSDVRGLRVASGAPRPALEQLQAIFPFDVTVSGYKMKFVSRGGASVATIPETDLGARASGDSSVVLLPIAREMDSQIPATVRVKYLNPDREYDAGEQFATRPGTASVDERVVETGVVLNDTEAARAADVLNQKDWTERRDFGPFALPPTYANLEPADVVTVQHRGTSYDLRLTRVEYLPDGRLDCSGRLTAAQSYTSTATGVPSLVVGQSTVPLKGSTALYLLDIPRIRSEQDVPGMAFGVLGKASGWPGAVVLRSDDSGATWQSVASTTTNADVFTASGALSAHHGYSIDHSTLTVVPETSGADLFSVTEDQLYSEANLAAYGADGRWEIVALRNATDNGSDFTIGGFLRGLYGTEWATGLHVAGDALIMLDEASIGFFGLPTNALNASRTYRAPTLGSDIDAAVDVVDVYESNNLKPLSLVDVNGTRDTDTKDWSLLAQRRTRWPVELFSGMDVPLGETSEAYEVEIYADGTYSTIKRTLSGLTTAAATYTSAQQVADFGSNQATLYLKWRMLSAVVGRGIPLQTSIYRFVSNDAFGEWVKLLMHMNDTGLTDYKSHAVTKNGNAQRVVDAAMFDGYAADFDGTGDYLTITYTTADFDWWSESFTIEYFIIVDDLATVSYLDGVQKSAVVGNADPASGANYWSFGPINDGTLRFAYWNGAAQRLSSSSTITAGVRSHVAFCSDSSGIRIYLDGNRIANGTNAGGNQSSVSYPLTIGQINNRSINGRIDELRITKGGPTARYTGTTYTVPTTSFPDP